MSGKVVSLSKARKAKARAERKRQADANATRHGLSRAERKAEATQQETEVKRLDGHRRDDHGPDEP